MAISQPEVEVNAASEAAPKAIPEPPVVKTSAAEMPEPANLATVLGVPFLAACVILIILRLTMGLPVLGRVPSRVK